VFSVIDINSAFSQIKNDHRTSLVYSIRTPKAQYRMLRLPFGAMNSPATWLRLMDKVLKGLKSVKLLWTILLYSPKQKKSIWMYKIATGAAVRRRVDFQT